MAHSKFLVIGIPRELMSDERRMPLLPHTITRLRESIPEKELMFLVEHGVGMTIGCDLGWGTDGARIVERDQLYREADIIIKVKQPFPEEIALYRSGQGCCGFHHMATNREVVDVLLQKGVKILPLEYHRPSLTAMSRHTGKWLPSLIGEQFDSSWKWQQENIFLGGGRGVVCQYVVYSLLGSYELRPSQIHACDLVRGRFISPETSVSYWTFSGEDDDELCERLSYCRIVVLAAVRKGGAPKFLKPRHLEYMPEGVLIFQVSIDEGGNIDDPEFCRVTSWQKLVYTVVRHNKLYRVYNIPNIPGALFPELASYALDVANFPYYREIFSRWPEVPGQYLFSGWPS